jgi:superfamily II DNA helicase RecQ
MIKIITLAFEPENQCFNDEALQGFLAGKAIKQVKPQFFQLNGQAFWTVWIEYEPLMPESEKAKPDKNFNAVQQQLLTELQQWRREKAANEKIPVYIIATNKELAAIVETQPRTLESLRMIQGFGHKKTERHGKEILLIVSRFADCDHTEKE